MSVMQKSVEGRPKRRNSSNLRRSLKKEAENRAMNLEAEVKKLREELKYIQKLSGLDLENSNSGNS